MKSVTDEIDQHITDQFADLHRSITDEYAELESSTFARIVTAVAEADAEEPADMVTATLIVGLSLVGLVTIEGDFAGAAFLAILFGLVLIAAIRRKAH